MVQDKLVSTSVTATKTIFSPSLNKWLARCAYESATGEASGVAYKAIAYSTAGAKFLCDLNDWGTG